jgi:hypothetical protein
LSKNTPGVKELLTAILKAIENVGAHKVTRRKQGVSFSCCPFINPSGDHEDILEFDQLCVQLYVEYQEAIKHNNLLDKENIHNASQFLVPNPQPLACSGAATCHPLSAISNEVPLPTLHLGQKNNV